MSAFWVMCFAKIRIERGENMAEKSILEIPDGYKIEEKSYIVDRETACRILTSDKQRKFTYAKKLGEKVELTQHIIICPVCGHRMPAYPRYTNGWLAQSFFQTVKTPKNVIRQWCEDKISDSKDTIYLNFISQPVLENVIYTCPECRCESNLFSKIVRCELNYRRHKLSISRQIDDTKALLSVSWLKGTVNVNFPMYEELTFNFKNGHTFVRLLDRNKAAIATCDVTERKELLQDSFFARLLGCNKRVVRLVKKFFVCEWQSNLPFKTSELNLTKFMLLTEFIGYPKIFYHSIPYAIGTHNVYSLFKSRRKALHSARRIVKRYESVSWMRAKSIRKLIFLNPAFLFYEHECEALSEIFVNVNLFRSVLCMPDIFTVLGRLNENRGILDFLRDYAAVKGEMSLKREMMTSPFYLNEYAFRYGGLSDRAKVRERKQWKNGISIKDICKFDTARVSLPVFSCDIGIPDCVVYGFHFFRLGSESDYFEASNKLNNCLRFFPDRSDKADNNPVICVSKGEKLVAAIEVHGKSIVQASGYSNRPLEYDPYLYKAYTIWRKKYNLHEGRQ